MSSAGHYGPDGQRIQADREALAKRHHERTWNPLAVYQRRLPAPAEAELDALDESLDSARRVIQHVAAHPWEGEMRVLCQAWLDLHPDADLSLPLGGAR